MPASSPGSLPAPHVDLSFREVGGGAPVLLLHGGGPGCSSWLDFAPCLPHLAQDRRYLFVDLALYGASAADPLHGPVFDAQAAQVLGLLDRLGIDRVEIIGQSLGGSVALNLAALHPDRVSRIVLTGSQPVPDPEADVSTAIAARDRYYGHGGPSPAKMRDLLAELEWYDGTQIPEATVLGRYRNSITGWSLAVADGSGRGDPQDLSDRLREVSQPVLWIGGADDPFSSPAYAVRVAATLPRADVSVLARTSHHPQEERPAAYGRLVSEFLDRKESS